MPIPEWESEEDRVMSHTGLITRLLMVWTLALVVLSLIPALLLYLAWNR